MSIQRVVCVHMFSLFTECSVHSHILQLESLCHFLLPSPSLALPIICPISVLQIVEHTEENKMTPSNLAIVLGPNLVWSQSEVASLTSIGEINTFVLLLINNYGYIF